jgi:hypothetical protein
MVATTGDAVSANDVDPPEYSEEVPKLELRYDSHVRSLSLLGQ